MTTTIIIPFKKIILGSVSVLALLVISIGSFYTVDQGSRGVKLRNGAIVGIAEPGLGFKFPFIDSVSLISVQDQAQVYEGVQAYSRDQQTATMKVSVSYAVPQDQVSNVYSEYGSESNLVTRLLDRQVNKTLEEVFGQYDASTAVKERARLGIEFQTAIQKAVQGPILIKSVQVEGIDFTKEYERSIEEVTLAESAVSKAKQVAESEKVNAQIAVIQAQAKADSQVATAKALAAATRLQGDAEADAIKAKSAALASNPALIALTQAEKWDGHLPTTMVPNSTVPFLNLTPQP